MLTRKNSLLIRSLLLANNAVESALSLAVASEGCLLFALTYGFGSKCCMADGDSTYAFCSRHTFRSRQLSHPHPGGGWALPDPVSTLDQFRTEFARISRSQCSALPDREAHTHAPREIEFGAAPEIGHLFSAPVMTTRERGSDASERARAAREINSLSLFSVVFSLSCSLPLHGALGRN